MIPQTFTVIGVVRTIVYVPFQGQLQAPSQNPLYLHSHQAETWGQTQTPARVQPLELSNEQSSGLVAKPLSA